MQENRKTFAYLVVAALALLAAWEPWRQVSSGSNVPSDVGTKLFSEFKDPLAAKSLEIVQFDEDTATIRPFKVAQVGGIWSIPSHNNYPADAREHMAQAATALVDLEVLGVASSTPGDQELYGVIAPDPQKLRQGMVGVGTRVTLKDGKDNTLADLVIGKEVKDQPALRYVRRADRDQICRVNIKTDKLSTKFEDWIEKDLLKLNAFDVRQVELNDYSLEEGVTAQGGIGLRMHQRSQARLGFDDSKSSWNLIDLAEFDEKGQPVPVELADDEELNTEKLNNLKSALDDLKIVDVERKPKGLSQDLRASDEFVKDNETRMSLIQRGFYPVPTKGQIEIFSSEGEATCTTKDGVRYVLRFGQLAGGEENKDEGKPDETKKKNPALNRFLFVMAQFDDGQIAKPQFEAEPGAEKPADQPATEEKADEKKVDEPKASEKKPAAKKSAEEKVPQKKTADDGQPDQPADKPADENTKDNKKPAAPQAEKPKEEKPATPDDEKRIAIQKENKRKQDEYNEAIKKGQDKVKELNDRFADWYFIISDEVYKKIHLGRGDIVKKKKEAEADKEKTGGVGDLKQFEKGLKEE
ncbi:MAG: DUF4340 domain-containing protein [Planctomycetia bacterium]|nr:DUF4340 domain-containing protein [Planctomycetia bacterium]